MAQRTKPIAGSYITIEQRRYNKLEDQTPVDFLDAAHRTYRAKVLQYDRRKAG